MQHDVYTSSTSSETYSGPNGDQVTGHEDRGALGYVSNLFGTVRGAATGAGSFVSDRPLLAGSAAFAILGAIAGSRVARFQEARSRKKNVERTMGSLTSLLSGRIPLGSGDGSMIRDRQRDLLSATRNIRASVSERLPSGGTRRPARTLEKIGYAVSLVPVGLALLRNPLIRGLGARALARRVTGGVRRRR